MNRAAIARRYAGALLAEAADKDAALVHLEGLDAAAATFAGREVRAALTNPAVAPEDQALVLADLAKALGLADKLSNFLRVLFDGGRISCLPEVASTYRHLFEERFQVRRAQVRSAGPLDPEVEGQLKAKLEELTGGEVTLEVTEDPSLVAGWRARVGNYLIEADLGTRLNVIRDRVVRG